MNRTNPEEPVAKRFSRDGRKMIRLSEETLIKTDFLDPVEKFPLVIEPNVGDLNVVSWAEAHRDYIEGELLSHGAILLRNFHTDGLDQFEQFAKALADELLDYRERAAPRTEVRKNIYTSTEYPADQHIPLHHEMSYSHNWPTKIWFYCAQLAEEGGNTPIAPDRKVFRLIPEKIKERFLQKGLIYVRNYGEGLDLPWQEVFQTSDRSVVELYCRQSHTSFEWRDQKRLRTYAHRQVVAMHPKTNETVWFNHAHMFHTSNVEPAARRALLARYQPDELPRNVFYGDGTPIEDSALEDIRLIYREASISFPWQKGDILMLDNFLVSHGREPFVGSRKILVAMADLYTNDSLKRSFS
jgi:alpha-ketoglutarate-dependent taurine dioxygenase